MKCKLKRVGVYCHGWKKVSIIWLERLSHISQWRYFFINKLTVWAFQGKKFILIYSYTEYGFSSNFGDKNTKIMHSFINRIENCVWPFLSGIIYITFVIRPLRCLKPCIENRHTFIYTVQSLKVLTWDRGEGGHSLGCGSLKWIANRNWKVFNKDDIYKFSKVSYIECFGYKFSLYINIYIWLCSRIIIWFDLFY